jgi:hypothetical protein
LTRADLGVAARATDSEAQENAPKQNSKRVNTTTATNPAAARSGFAACTTPALKKVPHLMRQSESSTALAGAANQAATETTPPSDCAACITNAFIKSGNAQMAKDVRHYAKFTLDFPDNPKILPLSDAAFRALVEATIWSRRHQTDGLVPRAVAVAKWSLEILHELCTNDDDFPSLFESPNGWIIHDYADHQDTKAEIRARLEQARTAGSKGGQASAQARAKQALKQKPSKRSSKIQPEKEKDLLDPYGSSGLATSAPRTVNGAARDAEEAIRRCGLCDNRGYIGLRAGPFISCPHDKKLIDQMEHEYEAAE